MEKLQVMQRSYFKTRSCSNFIQEESKKVQQQTMDV